jgi:nitric oxide reductase subunit B
MSDVEQLSPRWRYGVIGTFVLGFAVLILLTCTAFYFLMAVGFWNFVGAGVFGFLINTPIVSYYEVGTILTPNHGHAALMGVFGMLGAGLMVFVLRETVEDEVWARLLRWVRVAFWGLNVGLAMMVVFSLFPGGILQVVDVIEKGYWHARGLQYIASPLARTLEWLRMPGDLVFMFAGALPLAVVMTLGYFSLWKGARRPRQEVLPLTATSRSDGNP